MVLLDGFIKKTPATDKSEINLAKTRYKDCKQHHEKAQSTRRIKF
jgi:phage-related protein